MAVGDVIPYNSARLYFVSGVFDNTLRITLHTGYTPDVDTHELWSDVSATEYSTGGGYTANGIAFSLSWSQDNSLNLALADCADFAWASLTLSPDKPDAAIIREPNSGTLLCYIELGAGSDATNGTDYVLTVSSSPAALLKL